MVEPFSMPTPGRGSRLPLVGRRPLSYRFLCQVKFQLLRVILREHGIKAGKGSLKKPCQVQIGFDVWQDCDTFDVCWVLTNFLGFLGVECWDAEDQRVFCFVAWAAPDVFWTRRMRLLQQNIVEISDFEIPCFGSVLRVLVVIPSFYPSLWWNKRHTNHGIKTSELSVNWNGSCHHLGPKIQYIFLSHGFSMFFCVFLGPQL